MMSDIALDYDESDMSSSLNSFAEDRGKFQSLSAALNKMPRSKLKQRSVSPPPGLDVEVAKVNCW